MPKKPRVVTLRAYVESHPRGVRRYQIAQKLGISQWQLSNFMRGVRPGPIIAKRLLDRGVVFDDEVAS